MPPGLASAPAARPRTPTTPCVAARRSPDRRAGRASPGRPRLLTRCCIIHHAAASRSQNGLRGGDSHMGTGPARPLRVPPGPGPGPSRRMAALPARGTSPLPRRPPAAPRGARAPFVITRAQGAAPCVGGGQALTEPAAAAAGLQQDSGRTDRRTRSRTNGRSAGETGRGGGAARGERSGGCGYQGPAAACARATRLTSCSRLTRCSHLPALTEWARRTGGIRRQVSSAARPAPAPRAQRPAPAYGPGSPGPLGRVTAGHQ
ncbi:translation initiation factor IF-2-like [Trachypithecus francoisi]|uniref:translation initiation factor IF-2-like n=1 Tax=Trachypithecus francoisi TaxID=54180 RepID=UPI00141B2982|nr:translation initiation factor IF-2-like [Trachypithecus francoisi]